MRVRWSAGVHGCVCVWVCEWNLDTHILRTHTSIRVQVDKTFFFFFFFFFTIV